MKLLHVRDEQPRRGGLRCADMSLDLVARLGEDFRVPPTRDRRELIRHDLERELISKERADELLRKLES